MDIVDVARDGHSDRNGGLSRGGNRLVNGLGDRFDNRRGAILGSAGIFDGGADGMTLLVKYSGAHIGASEIHADNSLLTHERRLYPLGKKLSLRLAPLGI